MTQRVDWFSVLRFLVFAAVATWMVLAASRVFADSLTVTWTAPTEREDGTPLPASEIAGYRLMRWFNGAEQPEVSLASIPSVATLDVQPGKHCVAMRTVDTDGLESAPTDQVCRKAKPKAPGNLRVR